MLNSSALRPTMDPFSRVGIDLDGVMIDHRRHICLLAKEYGCSLEPWQANVNLIGDFLTPEMRAEMTTPLFCQLTPGADQAAGLPEMLAELRQRAYIISTRRPDEIRFAQEWLLKQRIYDLVPAERIFFCGTEAEKKSCCQKLALSAFIDDDLEVLRQLPYGVKKILFDPDGAAARLALDESVSVAADWADIGRLLAA